MYLNNHYSKHIHATATAASQCNVDLTSLEQPPEDGVELALALGLLDENDPLRDVLGLMDKELMEELTDEGRMDEELEVDDGLEPPPIYGQGLQSLYESPHVCPRRHVQVEPVESLQFETPVQV